jgi:hypothetical protein
MELLFGLLEVFDNRLSYIFFFFLLFTDAIASLIIGSRVFLHTEIIDKSRIKTILKKIKNLKNKKVEEEKNSRGELTDM